MWLLGGISGELLRACWSVSRVYIYISKLTHDRYYLGISPSRLASYYAGSGYVSRASKLFACNTMHLFNIDHTGIDYRSTSTFRLLSSVSDRPPRFTPIEYHLATSRFLLGHGLADRLGLPSTTTRMRWRLRITRWIEWSLIAFGRVYRTEWEVERVGCTRLLVTMIVCWQLGERRTRFTIKSFAADIVLPVIVPDPKPDSESQSINDRDGKLVGEEKKGKEVDPDDDELDPEIELGPAAGKRIIGRWRWLLLEMMGVLVSPVVLLAAGSYLANVRNTR